MSKWCQEGAPRAPVVSLCQLHGTFSTTVWSRSGSAPGRPRLPACTAWRLVWPGGSRRLTVALWVYIPMLTRGTFRRCSQAYPQNLLDSIGRYCTESYDQAQKNPPGCGFPCVFWTVLDSPQTMHWCQEGTRISHSIKATEALRRKCPHKCPQFEPVYAPSTNLEHFRRNSSGYPR